MKTNITILTLAFLASGLSLASSDESSLEDRVRQLEETVLSIQSGNPKTIVVSECLAKVTTCKVSVIPHTVGHHAQYSYVVRQSLALAFENGTISSLNSDKTMSKKFSNLETSGIAKDACEKSQAEVKDLITACP